MEGTKQAQSIQKIKIWLDCDSGLDDTVALIMAGTDKKFDLLGVSTTAGNTNLQNTKNALDVLHNCGRSDVVVIKGSDKLVSNIEGKIAEFVHGPSGLGGVKLPPSPSKPIISQNPSKQIYDRIMKTQGQIIWVNTGTMTNLYYLLKNYPEVKSKIKQIVAMGGAVGKGNITPAAEFNIFFDPSAAQGVVKMKENIPLTMIPLELTHTVIAGQYVLQELKEHGSPLTDVIYTMLDSYREMYWKTQGFLFPPIHDPTTLYYILHPEQFQAKNAMIEVDTGKTSFGRTNFYFHPPQDFNAHLNSPDKVVLEMKDISKFWEHNFNLYRQISGKPKPFKSTIRQYKKMASQHRMVIIGIIFFLYCIYNFVTGKKQEKLSQGQKKKSQ